MFFPFFFYRPVARSIIILVWGFITCAVSNHPAPPRRETIPPRPTRLATRRYTTPYLILPVEETMSVF